MHRRRRAATRRGSPSAASCSSPARVPTTPPARVPVPPSRSRCAGCSRTSTRWHGPRAARCRTRFGSACTSATWRTSTRWTPSAAASSPTRCPRGRRSSPISSASTSRATPSSGSATEMEVAALDTPVATVDMDAVERNIARMQGYCDEHGLAFRPHIKTHKLPGIAYMQVEAGAVGITCQKLGEAEVMQAAGLRDILISFPLIGEEKAERLAALAREGELSVAADSAAVARGLSQALASAGAEAGFLVECDTGFARTGVQTPKEAAELAEF